MHNIDLLYEIEKVLGPGFNSHDLALYLLGLAAEEIKRLKAAEDNIKQVEFPKRVAKVKAHFDRELESRTEALAEARLSDRERVIEYISNNYQDHNIASLCDAIREL